MLRVLYLVYDDPGNPWVGGGGAVRAREIHRRLAGDLDITVATGNYPEARNEERDGVRYVRLGLRRPYAASRLSFAAAAARLLRTAEFDAALYELSVYAPVPLPRGRPAGMVVHHLTGSTAAARWGPLAGAAVAAAERRLVRRARWIGFSSLHTMDRVAAFVDAGVEMVHVGAGVGEEFFRVERGEGEYVLFLGRLDLFQKGLDTLLDAMAILAEDDGAPMLRIAGRGRDGPRVHARVRRLGLERRVSLLGEVSHAEKLRLLAGAALLVMPSRFEGFGLVAAEAMAAGVPVLASTAGALPEVIDPPRGGVLVPPGDAPALAAGLASLLGDAPRRAELGRSARTSARRFDWNAVAARHLEFVRRVAAVPRPPGVRP
jgi:glycosyltransferase involved in cell wall biosynthesis